MKKVFSLFIFLATCAFNFSVAQPITFERYYDYGFAETGYCVQQTTDGGYIIAGAQGIGFGTSKIILLKTDSFGQEQWHKLIGGPYDNYGYSVQQTTDGGYIIAGYTTRVGNAADVYLIKTDSNGDTLWTKAWGTPVGEVSYSVRQTNDGGYIVAGQKDTLAYLIKTDSIGDTLWTKTYLPTASYGGGGFYSISLTNDGGYILTGTMNFATTGNDVYLVKTDSLGDTLWTRTWGGAGWDRGQSVQQTIDSGYIIAGFTYSFGSGSYDVYLIKTDVNGDTLWTKTFGDIEGNTGSAVQPTIDGGYIIAGNTWNGFDENIYLIKTDGNGDTLWTKTFGGSADDFIGYDGSVRQTSDGGYIITGLTLAGSNVYLIKTDSIGSVPVGITEIENKKYSLEIFPNPFLDFTTIIIPDELMNISELSLTIYDLTGRVSMHTGIAKGNNKITIQKNELQSGMYICQLLIEKKIFTAKIIIQ